MSGQGLPPGRAPTRLLTILGDQPIGLDDAGRPVKPSMEFVQFLQRLISYIGQPVPANPAGVPISTVIGSLSVAAKSIRFGAAGDGAILAQVSELEAAISRLAALVPPQPEPERGEAAHAFQAWPVDIVYAGNGSRLLDGHGTPNGRIFGSVGDVYMQRDGTAAVATWEKTSGLFTDHGWTAIGGELPNHQTASTYTVTAGNWTELIAFDSTASVAVSLVQPGTASGVEASFYADIENINTGAVVLTPTLSKIDGSTLALTLGANQGVRIASDGTNYFTQRGMGLASAVSTIVAGTGLTGGTIISSGTVALDPFGTGLTITAGTIWPDWQGGSVTALGTVSGGATVEINSGTLGVVIPAAGTGTVTDIVTSGSGISGGPITGVGTLTVEWNGGTVNALSVGGTVSSGTLVFGYQAGTLTTFNTGLTLAGGTLTPNWQAPTVTALGSGLADSSGTLSVSGVTSINSFALDFFRCATPTGANAAADATLGNGFVTTASIVVSSLSQIFNSLTSTATLIANISSIASGGSVISVAGTSAALSSLGTGWSRETFVFSPAITLAAGTYVATVSCTNEGTAYALPAMYASAAYPTQFNYPNIGSCTGFWVLAQQTIAAGQTLTLSSASRATNMILNYST